MRGRRAKGRTMNTDLRSLAVSVGAAFVLWFFTFAVQAGNFWVKLILSAGLLAGCGLYLSRSDLKGLFSFKPLDLGIGVVSAVLLYGIFWAGREAATFLFPFAQSQISSVYATKGQLEVVLIGLLLVFGMGPAEEIYWHGFVQRRLVQGYGAVAGVLATALIYALVHAVSLNFMLVVAAGVCGLYWGLLFQKVQRLPPLIISHSLWDLLIFVLFPLG